MSFSYNFDDILRAMHNAVIEAQKLSEQQHLRQLSRYFIQGTFFRSDFGPELVKKLEEKEIVIPDKSMPEKKIKFTLFISDETTLRELLKDIDLSNKEIELVVSKWKELNNEIGNPILKKIKIPNTNPDSKEEWREINVPMLSLLPPTSIKIKEMVVEFKARLAGFEKIEDTQEAKKGFEGIETDKATKKAPLQIDFGHRFTSNSSLANIKIVFEGTDPPESILKINDQLVKVIP